MKMACGLCGGHLEFDANLDGRLIVCPHCRAEIMLHGPERAEGTRWRWLPVTHSVLLLTAALSAPYVIQSWKAAAPWWENLEYPAALMVLLALYLAPVWIAEDRRHRNAAGIALVNLLLGWTLLGWIAALVWAVYRDKHEAPAS